MLGYSRQEGVSGQTNKYADGRIENFGRECESLLPPVTPLTDLLPFQPQRANTLRMTEWPLPRVSLDAEGALKPQHKSSEESREGECAATTEAGRRQGRRPEAIREIEREEECAAECVATTEAGRCNR
jgi:hypothetical protein